jgi:molybdopterin-guanine dinucleotide biosynthesis protein A
LAGEPLIKHILDKVDNIVDEKIVVVSSKLQAENFTKAIDSSVNVLVDKGEVRSPLVGALAGFEMARGKYVSLLPCDTPLASTDVLLFLFELCISKNAVIPRWSNGYIEPLQAVYYTKSALEAAKNALDQGKLNMQSMVDRLQSVRYISTLVLKQLDPDLRTFVNVNTPLDLKKAQLILKHK